MIFDEAKSTVLSFSAPFTLGDIPGKSAGCCANVGFTLGAMVCVPAMVIEVAPNILTAITNRYDEGSGIGRKRKAEQQGTTQQAYDFHALLPDGCWNDFNA